MRRQAFSALAVSTCNAVALITTVLLYRIIARNFAPRETDAFFIALALISVFVVPAYNAISSTLTPTLVTQSFVSHNRTPILIGATLWWAFCSGILVTFVVALAVDGVGALIPAESSTSQFVREDVLQLGPLILLQALGAVLAAASQAAGRYPAPAVAMVCQQMVTLVLLLVADKVGLARNLPAAFTLGASTYLVVLLITWPWHKAPIQISFGIPRELASAAQLALPIIAGTLALQLALVGLRIFASSLRPGAVTAFDLAYRMTSALVEVSAAGVLTVALTQWSAAAATGQRHLLESRFFGTLSLVLFAVLPVGVALHATREPVVDLWLSSAGVDASIATMTLSALSIFLLFAPLEIAGRLYTRMLIAQHRTRPLGWIALQRMAIALILGWLFVRSGSVGALAAAEAVGVSVTLLALHHVAVGRWNWRTGSVWLLGRLALPAFLSWLLATFVLDAIDGAVDWVRCVAGAGTAVVTYVAISWLTKSPELLSLLGLFGRFTEAPPADAGTPIDARHIRKPPK